MLRAAVLLVACPDDASNDGRSGTGDDALAPGRVETVRLPSPRLHRWYAPGLAIAPSPGPDEILHVPKPLLA